MDEEDVVRVDGRFVPLHQLLDFIEGNDDAIPNTGVDITLLPPTNATADMTDEDSGEEDNVEIDNVPPSQVNAPALLEVVNIPFDEQKSNICENENTEELSKTVSIEQKTHKRKNRDLLLSTRSTQLSEKKKKSFNWKINSDLETILEDWPLMLTVPNIEKTPLEYFELFFDEDVINMIVTYTNQYAAKRNRLGDCSESEMKSFLCVLLLSGYNTVSRREMYWEQSSDCHNPLVVEALSRDRFRFIMQNLHVCNNDELDHKDRFAKIRPLLVKINQRCKSFMPHHQNHSIDESMVPYFGRHGTKQFIRGKPIRYGFKFWCGGPSNGYLVWLEPYQGSGTLPPQYANYGLGYGVVMTYADTLEKMPYTFYFDNFFTSFQLLSDLKQRGINATGTIRSNRFGKGCPISESKTVKKKPRGSMEYASDHDSGLLLVSWNDNSVVNIATNSDTVHPLRHVQRYSQERKEKISVPQPKLIHNYNTSMGGIDRADQNISLYRVSIRGKKWYFPLIAHLLDVSVQNAWQLHRQDGGKLDQLAFRRRIVLAVLEGNKRVVSGRGRPSTSSKIDSR
ncbi:hypothetical protein J6590_108807 [Homalodisca vitripennis]|nr:hypothetical protein J6590_108807 [Homalodisca vitripennis]